MLAGLEEICLLVSTRFVATVKNSKSRNTKMMPMMPPGGMGAGGEGGKGDKPVEKRVAAPGVPNGQPVKGRMTTPPSVPVTKSVEGKPAAVVTTQKRIVEKPAEAE